MTPDPKGRTEDQPDMFSSGTSSGPARRKTKRGPKHQKETRVLERLRDRIELAVKELHRLREENHLLHKELDSVRMHGLDALDGTPVVFTESPKALRKQIRGYIDTIERCIDQADSGSAPEPGS